MAYAPRTTPTRDSAVTVLLLIPDRAFADLYQVKFEHDGYLVLRPVDGLPLGEAIRASRPDVVVCDARTSKGVRMIDEVRLVLPDAPLLVIADEDRTELAERGFVPRPWEHLLIWRRPPGAQAVQHGGSAAALIA